MVYKTMAISAYLAHERFTNDMKTKVDILYCRRSCIAKNGLYTSFKVSIKHILVHSLEAQQLQPRILWHTLHVPT